MAEGSFGGAYGVGNVSFRVVHDNGEDTQDITPIVTGVTWAGDVKKPRRSLEVNLSNTRDMRTRTIFIRIGGEVRFYVGDEERFRGVVFSDDIDVAGSHSFTAFDTNIYLTKNADSRKFKKRRASDIVKRLCDDFAIPYGVIEDTGYVIPKLYFTKETSLWDMIKTAITETEKEMGVRYSVRNVNGELVLRQRKSELTERVVEVEKNLTSASNNRSIEEMRNQVKIINDEGFQLKVVKNDALIDQYGLMQHVEKKSDNSTGNTQTADQLLADLGTIEDEADVTALGHPDMVAGTAVYVREPMTRITGGYFVTADKHSFDPNGKHTVDLTIAATPELPTLEYEAPNEGGTA
ncbi:XkdQ/YqbQ family protein [Salibacterium lacus]|uniref:YqbQ/XkdQ domain-containing protein n=1 Tax=Salibacterium lacus TaxID=1898109 RepID=A0ABW5SYL4_9BACI